MKTFNVQGGVPTCNNCEVGTKRCKGVKNSDVASNGCKHHSGRSVARDTMLQDFPAKRY